MSASAKRDVCISRPFCRQAQRSTVFSHLDWPSCSIFSDLLPSLSPPVGSIQKAHDAYYTLLKAVKAEAKKKKQEEEEAAAKKGGSGKRSSSSAANGLVNGGQSGWVY